MRTRRYPYAPVAPRKTQPKKTRTGAKRPTPFRARIVVSLNGNDEPLVHDLTRESLLEMSVNCSDERLTNFCQRLLFPPKTCKRCKHVCVPPCAQCGSDPMIEEDTLCVNCDHAGQRPLTSTSRGSTVVSPPRPLLGRGRWSFSRGR